MRTRYWAVGSFVLLFAASAVAQPGHDKNNDKDHGPDRDHGKPAASAAASASPNAGASASPSASPSASAPGHNRDDESPAGNERATGRGHSPFAGVDESEDAQAKRMAHRKEQHEKIVATLKGKVKELSKEQRDLIAKHNRVIARLEWIRAWAENEKKTEVSTRVDAAIAKEDARFNKKLAALADKAGAK